jgi:hypothetical protein
VASRSGLHRPFLICDSRCSSILHLYLFHGTRTSTPPTPVTPLSESRSRKVTLLRQRRQAGGRRAYWCAAGSTARVRAAGGGAGERSPDRGVNKHEVRIGGQVAACMRSRLTMLFAVNFTPVASGTARNAFPACCTLSQYVRTSCSYDLQLLRVCLVARLYYLNSYKLGSAVLTPYKCVFLWCVW